ncbi:MAG: ATP-binding protein [Verrucomicrobia bacterium]|nr:ATP-binding protein [Verrucomicrobiota bacterium]
MNGTNSSTGGFWRTTRRGSRWTLRLVVFACVVAAALLLIVGIQTKVSRQMAALEHKFSSAQTDDFYVGVNARVQIRRLNDLLLDFQLTRNPDDRKQFLRGADDLWKWLRSREADLDTAQERDQFLEVKAAFAQYLADTKLLLEDTGADDVPLPFETTYQEVHRTSRPLLSSLEGFVTAQQGAFRLFLQTSEASLQALRRLLTLFLIVLLGLTITLVALVYRGMLAPLRRVLGQSQAAIERQEKLASLGRLAAGVAHEIRNPLTAIKFRLFSLRNSLPPDFANHEDAAVISAELNRLERIVKDFLQFARPSDPEVLRLPAQRMLQEVCKLLSPQLTEKVITLKVDSASPVWVNADHQQIKQVLINLVQNAADSIQHDGTITLSAQTKVEAFDGHYRPVAILSVADSGSGISPEVEKRLFDPFFTTKESGTGLGLVISARIVANHGGFMRYQTKLNHGTTFEIVLPGIDDHGTTNPAH